MKLLTDHKFELLYDTSKDDLIKNFFEPALSASLTYKRGVGYFTSGWLYYNARGIAYLLKNGGKINFIISPNLSKEDISYISGNFNEENIENIILKNIDEIEMQLKQEYKNLLGWLVYDKILEFRFAIPKVDLGEFHDKFGIFIDSKNNLLAFNGSINDSIKGYHNYESISVFPAWKNDTCSNFAQSLNERFDLLWNDNDPNLKIYSLSEIITNKLIKLRSSINEKERPYDIEKYRANQKVVSIPNWLNVRNYQKDALAAWLNQNGRGILSMATGSGKTITALSLVVKMKESLEELSVLVVVPYMHLLEQWSEEAKSFNIDFIKCNSDYPNWENYLKKSLNYYFLNSKHEIPRNHFLRRFLLFLQNLV